MTVKRMSGIYQHARGSWLTIVTHGLSSAFLVIVLLASLSAFVDGGRRSWWWFLGNDSCQGFAAQSAAMALGAPIQNVVWPGATLPTAYLYWRAVTGGVTDTPLSVEAAETLLSASVHFHWYQAAVYGTILVLLVYALASRWSGSPVLGLAAAALLACNEWFLWALFHVRAEVPSIAFALLACLWADSRCTCGWPVLRPVIFGLLIALAVLSKIQVLPLLLLPAWLYMRRAYADSAPLHVGISRGVQWAVAAIVVASSIPMLRTSAIGGATYGLPKHPSTFATSCFIATAVIVMLLLLFSRNARSRLGQCSRHVLLVASGSSLALWILVLPVLWFGGLKMAWASANTIAYGTLTFARYGLSLDAAGGWGRKGSLLDRVRSFVEFQGSSATYGWNLAIWAGVVLLGCSALVLMTSLVTRAARGSDDMLRGRVRLASTNLWIALALYATALLCDAATTHRTVSNASYAFYHIYSLPLYFMSMTVAIGAVLVPVSGFSVWHAVGPVSRLAAILLIGVVSFQLLLQTNRIKQWEAGMKPAEAYFGDGNSTRVIGSVSPEFWARTGVTYEAVRDLVLQREAAARNAAPASDK